MPGRQHLDGLRRVHVSAEDPGAPIPPRVEARAIAALRPRLQAEQVPPGLRAAQGPQIGVERPEGRRASEWERGVAAPESREGGPTRAVATYRRRAPMQALR